MSTQHPFQTNDDHLNELLEYLEDILEGREAEQELINKRTKEAQVIEDYDRAMRGIM